MSTRRPYAASMAIIALAAISACQKKESETAAPAKPAASAASAAQTAASAPAAPASTPVAAAAPQPNPERNAYFGETHLHTSWSVDAWVMGNRITGPADAYQYAQGATIKHPMGFDIKIDTPLDFMGVTDHSEYVGVTKQANTPGSYVSTLPAAQPMIMKDPTSAEEQNRVFSYILKLNSGAPVKALMDPKVTSTVWKENVQIADQQNKPGKFTAFCSYEWTSMPDNRNMHRNVFFRDCAKVPEYPFSSLDSTRPTDLWNWMDTQRKAGNELLAISHNANVSDGWMFPVDVDNTTGRPIDAAWAAARDRNERLTEIKQGKGQSEAHPLLSPNDEFANYELFQAILGLPDNVGRIDRITGSYVRQALKDGIAMQDTRGYNPYKQGMGGGSDSHNSASPYRQDNFFGLHADADGTVERRFAGVLIGGTMDVRLENPGGLTGVWAEENTRASLWDAMYRKETFGVSGPRIKVRLFGGWDYAADMLGEPGAAYRIAMSGLADGRIAVAAQAVGVAQAALDAAVRYAKEREAYGRPIFELQAVAFRLAEMATSVAVARQFYLHTARLLEAGLPCAREAAMAKLYATEMAERVCSDALQTFGGYGYLQDFPVERYCRDVRVCKIYEGTSDIQKLIVSRSL